MNKKRFAGFIIIVIATILTIVAILNDTPKIVGYDTYIVASGDTLWDIATLSNGYNNISQDAIVLDIRKASNITPYINPGDVIQIPIYEEK